LLVILYIKEMALFQKILNDNSLHER